MRCSSEINKAGCVSQSGDNCPFTRYAVCNAAYFRPWLLDAPHGWTVHTSQARIMAWTCSATDSVFVTVSVTPNGCHVLDSDKKWRQLCWTTSTWVDEDDL